MRKLIFLLMLLPFSVFANVSVNAGGKTLDQFFVMASEVFSKAVVVDPGVNGRLKVYGVSKSDDFKRVFYSILRVHKLSSLETEDLIQVFPLTNGQLRANMTDRQALNDFIASSISDVYISGSMSYFKGDTRPRYEYSFVQGQTRKIFDPDSLGLMIVPVNECLVQLKWQSYSTLVTCEPYRDHLKPEKDRERDAVPSIFDDEDKSELSGKKEKREPKNA
ncbi:hypothetical protein C9J12_22665 [Photobacterium frigidiphilum]|uniref:Uncharacterized protein n=1 Tax=Photobacterium frigidiphilum TaxID=264736 RepID=A0A2T3J997_9GAMM|nr:hypothetical protein [Photobacterium frigidiphilum]PSU45372.1 hypothetical protein C9J12_22665 [Photobacterium frigidiphilum]